MKKNTKLSRFKIRWLNTKILTLMILGMLFPVYQGYAQTYTYTGSVQTVNLAAGSYEIEAWGADGGNTTGTNSNAGVAKLGGKGGYAKGILTLSAPSTLSIYVGGKGNTEGLNVPGGFNGGGNSGGGTSVSGVCGSGGGASDIRVGGNALTDRVIVAGGGGGAGYQECNGAANVISGGHGGGLTGGTPVTGSYANRLGQGGTQTAGGAGGMEINYGATPGAGSFGLGGNGGTATSTSGNGAGGGGGWYGGGAGSHGFYCAGGGGGGSSYIGGVTGGVTIMYGDTGYMPNPDTTGNGTVIITNMAPCTGTPTAGTASATSRMCTSEPFTLSVVGATRAGGITYQWQRSDAGTGVWTDIQGATSAFHTVTNQTVSTDYRFVVECVPGNTSATSNTVTVLQGAPPTFFYEDFNTTPAGTSTNASPPTCWTYLDNHTGYGYTSTTAGQTGNGFYVYTPVNTGDLMLISPTTDNLGNGTKQLRFSARVSSTTYIPTQKLGVYTMDGTTSAATKTLLENNIPLTTAWQEFIVPLPATTDDYFAFDFDSQNGSAYIYIDDVYYEDLSPCAFPVGLNITNITHNSVDFSWSPSLAPGVTGYEYNISTPSSSSTGSVVAPTTSAQVGGLTPGTEYTIEIRSICGSSYGDWTTFPITFQTLCVAMTTNFYEDFNALPTGSSSNPEPPSCWTYLDTHTGYGYTTATAGQTGKGFYVYTPVNTGDLMLISPETVDLGNGTKQVRFSARVSSTTYISTQKLEIYSMDGVTGTANKTLLQTSIPLTTVWQEFTVPLPVTTDDYFAFSFDSQNSTAYIYIDDVYYEDLSPCAAPGGIGAINITATGATINWQKSLATGVTGYDYEVRDMNGNVIKSGTITNANTVSQSITGLDPGTYYEVYVRSKCGANSGFWTALPHKFATLCAVITGNFFEGFENVPIGGSTNPSEPLCWTYIDTNSGYAYTTTTAAQAPSTQGFYVYRTTATGDLMLVSPETANLGSGNKRIRFSAKVSSTTYIPYQNLEIYTMDANTGNATKTLVQGNFPLTTGWQEFIVYLPNTTDDYFAFSFNTATGSSYTYIDDIYYEDIPPLVVTVDKTDILCYGANSGEAIATVEGGKPPYSYSWSPSNDTIDSVINLVPGTHTVTVTDDRNTVTTATITILEPTAIVSGLTSTDVVCNGQNNGTASVTPSGGTPPYTVLWSDNTIGLTNSNLAPGNYSVTIRDANHCVLTENFTIDEPAVLTTSVGTHTNVTTYGGNDGLATVAVTGGTAPYSYTWSPSVSTTDTASNLTAGTYTVTVTDANGCTTNQVFVITEPAPPYVITLVSKTDVSCYGGNNGVITISVTGPNPPFTYSWSPSGGNGTTASNLTAGTYTVTVIDAANDMVSENFTITEPAPLNANVGSIVNVSCGGNKDGSATVSPLGGTAPYNYTWSNGETTATAVSLGAGNHFVIVTDANGCQTQQAFSVGQPTPILINTVNVTDASCNGQSDGAITVSVNGGMTPYSYSWSNNQTTPNLTNIPGGTYTLTVTDANGCTETKSFTVADPAFVYPPSAVNQGFCSDNNPQLADMVITGTNIQWYDAATGGNLLPATTTLTNGATYYASQSVNGCESASRTAVQVSLYQSIPLTTTNKSVCYNSVIQDVTIDGFNYMQLKWYSSATAPTALSPTTLLTSGTYYVSSFTNGVCESARQAVQITVMLQVPAPVVTPQQVCGSGNTLEDLNIGTTSGATLVWYASAQATTPLPETAQALSGTYYVEQVIGSCKSVRVAVPVQVIPVTAPAMTDLTTCSGTTIADFNAQVAPTKYVWYINNTTTMPLDENTLISSGTFYIAEENSGCISNRAQVSVVVNQRPNKPTGQAIQNLNAGATVADLQMNQTGVIWFASEANALTQTNQLPPNTPLINNKKYYGILTGGNNCASLPTEVEVRIKSVSNNEFDLTHLKYYPNPTDSELNISYVETITKVEVFNIAGQRVLSKEFDANDVKIDLSGFGAGTYMVRIQTDKASQFVKIVKK